MGRQSRFGVGRPAVLGVILGAMGSGTVGAAGVVSECTQSALEAAIAGGGEVSFDCGGTDIALDSPLVFESIEVQIDGASPAGTMRLIAADGAQTQLLKVSSSATVTLRNVALSGGRGPNGGAIDNAGTLVLDAVSIVDSRAEANGGAIANAGVMQATTLTLTGNVAGQAGGGLYNAGEASVAAAEWTENQAGAVGGAVANFGTLSATRLRLAANRSDSVGGGLYNRGTAALTQASVVDNLAAVAGGGVHSEGRLTLTNATIARNNSGSTGAVLLDGADSAGSLLNHVTIIDNLLADPTSQASAGLVINAEGSGSVLNTVLVNNGVGGQCFLRGAVGSVEGSVATDSSCTGFAVEAPEAIGLSQGTDQQVAGVTQTVYLPALPTVLLDGGRAEACNRQAVAAADQRGQPRPVGEGCDIGAVELDVVRPVVDLNGTGTGRDTTARFAENDAAVTLAPNVAVTGGDLAVLTRATAQLIGFSDAQAETLAADAGASGLTVRYQAAEGLLELSGSAEPATYAGVLATLRYRHAGEILGDPVRRVEVRVADDSLASLSAEILIRLEPINDAPVAVDDDYATPADTVLVIEAPGLLANDRDPDQQTLRASGAVASAGGADVVIGADGRLVYDPRAAYAGLTAGAVQEDRFNYFASDGAGARAEATVTVTVTGVNDAPSASDDRFVLSEDGLISLAAPGVLANDSDPDSNDSLRIPSPDAVTSGGLPITLSSDGALVFDPRNQPAVQALRSDELRTDTLSYTVSDSDGLTATAQIRLTIQGRNDSPQAANLGQEILFVDRAITLELGNAFSDPDAGDTLRFSATGLPASLSLDGDRGVLAGTPNSADVGRHAVTVTAVDESGARASSALELFIEREGNDPPRVIQTISDQVVDEGASWSIELADVFEDPDGDTLAFEVSGLPTGLGLSNDRLTGAPAFETAGNYVVTVAATDPDGASATTDFALQVDRPAQDLAVAVTPAAPQVAPAATVSWTVTVTNQGTAMAGGELKLQLAGVGLTVPEPAGCVRSVALQQVQLQCATGALAAGAEFVVTVQTQADRSGGLWMQAEVGDVASDLTPDDNQAATGVTVTALLAEQPAATFEVVDATRLAVLDVDGDGHLDIAVGTGGGRPTQLFRRSTSTAFEAAGALGDLGETRALVAGELDGTAGTDLVVVNAAGGHGLYSHAGQGRFVLAPQAIDGDQGLAAVVADLDEDGRDDLLVLNAAATPDVYFGEGADGLFRVSLEPTDAQSLGLSDLDGDGRPEPVFGLADGDVFQPTIGRRSYGARLALPTRGVTHWQGADLDGDGRGDLVAAVPQNSNGAAPELRVLLSAAPDTVTLGARADYGVTRRLAAGDLDGDGDVDIVSASPNGVVVLLVNDGSGRLRPHDTALDADATDLVLRDMDGDGDLDLVLLLVQPEAVQVWFNSGDLIFSDTAGRPLTAMHADPDEGSGAWSLPALLVLMLAMMRRRVRRAPTR